MSPRRAAWIAALAAATLPCCRSGPPRYHPGPGTYQTVDAARVDALAEARGLADQGEPAAALALLEGLWAVDPDDLHLGRLRQDLILELEGPAGATRLRAECAEAAGSGRVPALLLAARLEPDADRAARWIEQARAVDPRSAWPPYAAAHLAAREGDWARARSQVEKALELDAGHLPARRLEASLAARGNDPRRAAQLLRAWIRASADSPHVRASERLDAHLDLAHLLVISGEPGEALDLLTSLPGELFAAARAASLLASVHQGLGRPVQALEAARAAQRLDPEATLPLVQEALLQEAYLDDAAAAREAWRRVLERARARGDLSALLLGMRARIALERSPPPDGPPEPGAPAAAAGP